MAGSQQVDVDVVLAPSDACHAMSRLDAELVPASSI